MTWTVSVHHMVQFIRAAGYQRPERMSWDNVVKDGVCLFFLTGPHMSLFCESLISLHNG